MPSDEYQRGRNGDPPAAFVEAGMHVSILFTLPGLLANFKIAAKDKPSPELTASIKGFPLRYSASRWLDQSSITVDTGPLVQVTDLAVTCPLALYIPVTS